MRNLLGGHSKEMRSGGVTRMQCARKMKQ
jgi:hypothetical protein